MPGGQNEHLFRVQLDTGSSSRWVFGAGCKISGEPSDHAKRRLPIHTLYHPGPRALCHGQRRFATRYRDGSNIEGPVYTDTWCFPTRTGSNLSVNVVFGVVEKVDYLLAMSRIDGILGLGFGPPQPGTFNQTEPHSLSTVLRSEDLTANYRFCIAISRRGRSFLSLGCIPPEAPSPRFWIPVITDTGKWIIPCYGFGWGHSPTDGNFEKVTLPERPGSMHILLDSGTTHCYFPNNIVKFVYQKLGGREGGSEGFQLRNQLPDPTNIKQQMWINLGGSWNAWPQEALYGELADPAVSSADAAWYHGRLKSQGDDPKTCSILGVAFFEHYYVYFDADRNKAKVALEPRRQG
ncbi:aspartic peptidase domain-containing protein [Gautieria morchelliformis]|nr:aspartic peptidase domain-containing protein [Gautieria morchelliformis]